MDIHGDFFIPKELKMNTNLQTERSIIEEVAKTLRNNYTSAQLQKSADEIEDVFLDVAKSNKNNPTIGKIMEDLIIELKKDPIYALACLMVWKDTESL